VGFAFSGPEQGKVGMTTSVDYTQEFSKLYYLIALRDLSYSRCLNCAEGRQRYIALSLFWRGRDDRRIGVERRDSGLFRPIEHIEREDQQHADDRADRPSDLFP
jgi:hypothetical protein